MGLPLTIDALEAWLSEPPPSVVDAMRAMSGDLLLLGAGGKMGPTLARMARRAFDAAGRSGRVIAASRFSDDAARRRLEACGVETHAADLLVERDLERIPDCANVIAMIGFKFGASQSPDYAWAMNCHLPALVCRRFRDSRIVAFSTGNVYGPVPTDGSGSREDDVLNPVGEYAMTCVGRERIYQYMSRTHGMPIALLRLNYATEVRYGVLVDIARRVWDGTPVDVRCGRVNVIWLPDANAMTLLAFAHAATPARIINVAGLDILSVRDVARRFAERWGKEPVFSGVEQDTALLNDGRSGAITLDVPRASADRMIEWTAEWIESGGPLWDKPTHFEVTDGRF
ncbi:MAG: NAD(P)-dependent oxidoreductase [Planctomycetes bacterium]|nr:NAD(P)-dependent oxidoreductase [Planctomycetota bacterium]